MTSFRKEGKIVLWPQLYKRREGGILGDVIYEWSPSIKKVFVSYFYWSDFRIGCDGLNEEDVEKEGNGANRDRVSEHFFSPKNEKSFFQK